MANKLTDIEQENLLDEVQSHIEDSARFLEPRKEEWRENESIRLSQLTDDVTSKTGNTIFDPKLPTIVLERTSRVVASNPKGKAYAKSSDDVGKNAFMNLLLDHYYKNANEQDKMFIKLRMLSEYSQVYGTMFALVPWRINERTGYKGPELNILPIWNCFPQPTKRNVNDMDWFSVRSVVSTEWLKQQDRDVWMNVDELIESIREGDTGDEIPSDEKSETERILFPNAVSDATFPNIELFTEYRRDRWITWSPQRIDQKTGRPFILRVVGSEDKPAYPNYQLPIIAKHAFPLLDSPIGVGEYHRGKSLQILLNQLWNIYVTSAMYEVAPPLHISTVGGVVASSIKWGFGEKWFMQNPNQDVQAMRFGTAGISQFNTTFGAVISSLEAQAGTTSIRESAQTQSSLGKTPQAIQFMSERESARDEWERVMLETTLQDMYERWISLTVEKMDKKQAVRLFGAELEDIAKTYPDVKDMVKDGKVDIKKEMIKDTYDFVLETGSTIKKNIEADQNNTTVILKAVLENPQIIEAFRAKGKDIDIAELFKQWVVAGNHKNADKIIVDMEQPGVEEMQGQAELSPQDMENMSQEQPIPQTPQIDPNEFSDPDIQQLVLQAMSRQTGGIPPQA